VDTSGFVIFRFQSFSGSDFHISWQTTLDCTVWTAKWNWFENRVLFSQQTLLRAQSWWICLSSEQISFDWSKSHSCFQV